MLSQYLSNLREVVLDRRREGPLPRSAFQIWIGDAFLQQPRSHLRVAVTYRGAQRLVEIADARRYAGSGPERFLCPRRSPMMPLIVADPAFRGIRDDARFRAIARSMKLPI